MKKLTAVQVRRLKTGTQVSMRKNGREYHGYLVQYGNKKRIQIGKDTFVMIREVPEIEYFVEGDE